MAGLLHLALIVSLSFVEPEPTPPPESSLEVLILEDVGQPTSRASPDAALSQLDRAGESASGDATLAKFEQDAPEPTEQQPEDSLDAEALGSQETIVEQLVPETSPELHSAELEPEAPGPKVTTSLIPVEKSAPVLTAQADTEEPPVPATDALQALETRVDAAQILASRSFEIAQVTASLEAKSAAYAKRVRRKSISASTREFRYASYLGAWARKVERIGNINYPQAAKDQRIYGSLILHVAVRSDGSVEGIRVVKSSGYDVLDEAAMQIVELSAPFSPFPPDIAAETDVLDIVRTWQFMRGGVLGWER